MVQVGVIGLGMMGATHLDAYAQRGDVGVVAVAEKNPDLLHGKALAEGNIEGQAQRGADLSDAAKYEEGLDLIADERVELVDICLPTPLHVPFVRAALDAGKHVLIEKPLARTHTDAMRIVEAAANSDRVVMCAMCMRFWPGWTWLKQAIDERRYGRVLAAHFRRLASHPGGPFYANAEACGGAILDLHIHDTDFVQYCFGLPEAVTSAGYAHATEGIDHVFTRYEYAGGPMVTAEGGWAMAPGFGFTMQYTVNFERATAVFDLAADHTLKLYENGETKGVDLPAGMGYEHEIDYLIRCIAEGRQPQTVTVAQAAESVRMVEAELQSVTSGQRVVL